jgi:hypothetical protein
MTDLEINKALALAIGWKELDIYDDTVAVWYGAGIYANWRIFDYRDWDVIGPIAARYDCFPYQSQDGKWVTDQFCLKYFDTPQKAIAMAVIQGAKR